MANAASPGIRCREIAEADLPALAELLAKGFPRPAAYWTAALQTLARREAPENYPRFGFLLERDARPVGALLTIFTRVPGAPDRTRCNISSWYVDPESRAGGYASALIAAALRYKEVTYINVSPARHTWRIIEAQGFRRFCEGQILCAPALGGFAVKAKAEGFDPAALGAEESELLAAHQNSGCIPLIVREDDKIYPFVFAPRRVFHGLAPAAQLVFCRDIADFRRFAGVLGRRLALRGYFLIQLDANGPTPGLFGVYRANSGPKYFKGSDRPRCGDLAYCETVLFGP